MALPYSKNYQYIFKLTILYGPKIKEYEMQWKMQKNGERVLRAINASTALKRPLKLAHAPTQEPTPSPTTVSIPTTEPTIESRDWAIPTMATTMQQAPVSMQTQQSINMTIVAGVVIGGAPVTATATTNLRGKDKKRRKKRTCNYCLANGKGINVAQMCKGAQARGRCPMSVA